MFAWLVGVSLMLIVVAIMFVRSDDEVRRLKLHLYNSTKALREQTQRLGNLNRRFLVRGSALEAIQYQAQGSGFKAWAQKMAADAIERSCG